MKDISNSMKISYRDIFYYRARLKNNVYHNVLERFIDLASTEGLTKKQIADSLGKDQGWTSRQFSSPANWTLDTISDLLLAMDAELYCCILPLNTHVDDDQDVDRNAPFAAGTASNTNNVLIREFGLQ